MTNKTGDFKKTIRCCTKALKIDEKAIKALFLRSVAHLKTQNYKDAATDSKVSIVLNPKEKSFRDHWELIKTEKLRSHSLRKQQFERSFKREFETKRHQQK